jgi:uncharacterized protein YkuJ
MATITERAQEFLAACVPGEYARFTVNGDVVAEVYRYGYDPTLFEVQEPYDADKLGEEENVSHGCAEEAVPRLVDLAFASLERLLGEVLSEVVV